MGGEQIKMDTNIRMRVAFIVACAFVGVVMLSLLSLWIYHKKNLGKPRKKHGTNSGKNCFFRLPISLFGMILLLFID